MTPEWPQKTVAILVEDAATVTKPLWSFVIRYVAEKRGIVQKSFKAKCLKNASKNQHFFGIFSHKKRRFKKKTSKNPCHLKRSYFHEAIRIALQFPWKRLWKRWYNGIWSGWKSMSFFCIVFVIPPFVSFSFDCNLLQRPLIFLDRSCSPQRTPAPLNDTQEIHVGHNASNGFKLEIGQLEYRTFLLPAITRKTRKHTYCTWNFCFCANLVCSTYSEFSYQVLQVPITWTKTLDVSVKKGFQHGVPVPQEQRSQQSFSGHGSGSTSTGCLALSSSFAMCGSCVWGFPSELAETGRERGEKESPSFWEIWSGIVL